MQNFLIPQLVVKLEIQTAVSVFVGKTNSFQLIINLNISRENFFVKMPKCHEQEARHLVQLEHFAKKSASNKRYSLRVFFHWRLPVGEYGNFLQEKLLFLGFKKLISSAF